MEMIDGFNADCDHPVCNSIFDRLAGYYSASVIITDDIVSTLAARNLIVLELHLRVVFGFSLSA